MICQVCICLVGARALAEEGQGAQGEQAAQSTQDGQAVQGAQDGQKQEKAGATDAQIAAVKANCAEIKAKLEVVQHNDSRTRVNLGRNYETILSDYIMPLNVALVASNLSDVGLIENQSKFVAVRSVFAEDFISYQKALEELVGINCVAEPARFYEKLVMVRQKRATVASDTEKLRWLMGKQVEMVTKLREAK